MNEDEVGWVELAREAKDSITYNEARSKLADLRDEFKYHKVSPECALDLAAIRTEFRNLRDYLRDNIPNCRLRSIAITHLGEASRAAIAACVLSHPDSVAEGGHVSDVDALDGAVELTPAARIERLEDLAGKVARGEDLTWDEATEFRRAVAIGEIELTPEQQEALTTTVTQEQFAQDKATRSVEGTREPEELKADVDACLEALRELISFGGANTDTACEALKRTLPLRLLDRIGRLAF